MPVPVKITTQLIGAKKFYARLKTRVRIWNMQLERGLKRAGNELIRLSLQEVPIDRGVLRASWFVRARGSGSKTEVFVGYSAAYATMVHEDLTKAHGMAYNLKYAMDIKTRKKRRKREGEKAKFLEDPFFENREALIKIVRDSLKQS